MIPWYTMRTKWYEFFRTFFSVILSLHFLSCSNLNSYFLMAVVGGFFFPFLVFVSHHVFPGSVIMVFVIFEYWDTYTQLFECFIDCIYFLRGSSFSFLLFFLLPLSFLPAKNISFHFGETESVVGECRLSHMRYSRYNINICNFQHIFDLHNLQRHSNPHTSLHSIRIVEKVIRLKRKRKRKQNHVSTECSRTKRWKIKRGQ